MNVFLLDVAASVDKRMLIKTLKQFLQPYVGASADNFDVSAILHLLFLALFRPSPVGSTSACI